jgi:hypothetical protein
MAESLGGEGLTQTGGGGMPIGQVAQPSQDVANNAMQPESLSTYYQGGGGSAGIDASGRSYFTPQGGTPENLMTSPGAVQAGLIGTATPSGAANPSLAPQGVLPPGPGQAGEAAAAQTLAQGQAAPSPAAPPPAAPEAPIAPTAPPAPTNIQQLWPEGQTGTGVPTGWNTIQKANPTGSGGAISYIVSPDQQTVYEYNPETGAINPAMGGMEALAGMQDYVAPAVTAPTGQIGTLATNTLVVPPPPAPYEYAPQPDYYSYQNIGGVAEGSPSGPAASGESSGGEGGGGGGGGEGGGGGDF